MALLRLINSVSVINFRVTVFTFFLNCVTKEISARRGTKQIYIYIYIVNRFTLLNEDKLMENN